MDNNPVAWNENVAGSTIYRCSSMTTAGMGLWEKNRTAKQKIREENQ